MKLSIREDKLDYATFERLFTEAWDYISAERQRMGADNLKAGLWEAHKENKTLIYEEDGYVVGTISFKFHQYKRKKYLHYLYPTYGENESGSRAWFYSEEYKNSSDKLKSVFPDVEGVVMIGNPDSPAMTAIQNKYNDGVSLFTSMDILKVDEVFSREEISPPEHFRAFVMGI